MKKSCSTIWLEKKAALWAKDFLKGFNSGFKNRALGILDFSAVSKAGYFYQ